MSYNQLKNNFKLKVYTHHTCILSSMSATLYDIIIFFFFTLPLELLRVLFLVQTSDSTEFKRHSQNYRDLCRANIYLHQHAFKIH